MDLVISFMFGLIFGVLIASAAFSIVNEGNRKEEEWDEKKGKK